MRSALVFAIASALTWGVGSVLLKRISDTVSPTTFIVSQYVIGAILIGGSIVVTGHAGGALSEVGERWTGIFVAAIFLAGGYLLFIAAVKYAGEGSLPTAAAIAIASSYPAVVALLSATFLDEALGWNHALAVALVLTAVLLLQL